MGPIDGNGWSSDTVKPLYCLREKQFTLFTYVRTHTQRHGNLANVELDVFDNEDRETESRLFAEL